MRDEPPRSAKHDVGVTFPLEITEPGAVSKAYGKAAGVLKK
jgi:hypothetical protein